MIHYLSPKSRAFLDLVGELLAEKKLAKRGSKIILVLSFGFNIKSFALLITVFFSFRRELTKIGMDGGSLSKKEIQVANLSEIF